MPLKLDVVQRRVLGVLMEKALTTPTAYPLTLNAVVVGCNQLSCREPVLHLSDDEAAKALRELKGMGLVTEVDPERNARVERYKHNVEEELDWNEYKQAIVAELLLRGPQTPGELKTNASRMANLPDLQAVVMILEAFRSQDPPVVRELPRQPGKSASRYDHLFAAEPEVPIASPSPTTLEARVAKLELDLAALRQELRRLREDLGGPSGGRP